MELEIGTEIDLLISFSSFREATERVVGLAGYVQDTIGDGVFEAWK